MTTQTQPSAGSDAPGEPEPPAGSSVGLGDIVRAYLTKVRGGDLGSLPAILGLIVLVVVFSALKPDRFPSQFNVANLLNQSAAIVVLVDGPGVRAPARRDRPVGRLHRRHGGGGHGRGDDRARLALDPVADRLPAHRCGDRHDHRLAGGQAGHPVVRGDPGVLPRSAGRDAGDHRRGRHHRLPQRGHPRAQQRPDARLARLDPGGGGSRGVCRSDLAHRPPTSQGRPGEPARAAVGHQDLGAGHLRPAVRRLPVDGAQPQPGAEVDHGCARSSSPSWSGC